MKTLPHRSAEAMAVVLIVVGVTVCAAWLLQVRGLTQLLPNAAPMQFNTALGFVLMGVALLLVARGFARSARTCVIAVGALATMTLFEYLSGLNLGIDQFFVTDFVQTQTSHPGRMAPNTAAAFLLSSLSAGLITVRRQPFVSANLGAVVIALGGISLMGYAAGFSTAYGWGQLTRMAIHTSAGFVLLGSALIVHASRVSQTAHWLQVPWLSTTAAILIAGLSLLGWQALGAQLQAEHDQALALRGKAAAHRASTVTREWLSAFDRMANRYSAGSYRNTRIWIDDADSYFRDMPALELLAVVDESGTVQTWRSRLHDTEPAIPPKIPSTTTAALQEARPLLEGKTAWFVREMRGASGTVIRIAARLDSDRLMANVITPDEAKLFAHRLGLPDAARTGPSAPNTFRTQVPAPLAPLELEVWSIAPMTLGWRLADIVLFVGLCLALLLSVAITQAQVAYRRSDELEAAQAAVEARSQALEAANESLEQFAYSASHDLKAPIRAIVSFAELIKHRVAMAQTDSLKEPIDNITVSGQRLYSLLDTLMVVAHAGHIATAQIKTLSMRTIVEAALLSLQLPIEERSARIEIGELPIVSTEPDLLSQVWQNLIGNALKYQTARTPWVGVSAVRERAGWVYAVADRGPGIESKDYEEIFKLFRRGSPPAGIEGSGVGLAIVRRTITSLGGRIWVESLPGAGATFKFYLPDPPLLVMP